MLGRRFLLLVAVLMGLTALAASVAPREPLLRERTRQAATPTPTPLPTATPAPSLATRELTVSTSAPPAQLRVEQGQLVEVSVSGDEIDSVQLLDEIEPIDPDSPALFELLADRPGRYPITLLDAGRKVATLIVR
jgi:hypothetical protein